MSSDLVQRTQQQAAEPIQTTFEKQADGLAMALAGRIGTERFIRAAVTAFRTTPALQKCSRESVLGGLFIAAQLGLEIGGPRGLAYLVPYGREATLVIGYRGWIELFYRTGQVAKVETVDVREGDLFRRGSDSRTGGRWYEHAAASGDPSRRLLGVIAQVVLKDGTVQWDYLTDEEILARRPKRWTGTPWESWPDEMKRKTVLRHLVKMVRQSTDDLTLAAQSDETVQRRIPGVSDHVVQHLPVEGFPTPERRPEPNTRVDIEDPQEDVPPPEEDEEARYERESTEAFNAAQEPM